LVSYEVINLNNNEERLFFGDRIPEVPEEEMATAAGNQAGYVDVGTTVDYRFEVIRRQKDELLLELRARVEMVTGSDLEPGQRELWATVGLLPGQTAMLTGALKRSEYLQMKASSYELPFLSSLFAAAGAGNDLPVEETATVIFLTPSFQEKAEKTADRQGSRQTEPEPELLKPAISLVPEVPEIPAVPEVPEMPESTGTEQEDTPKTTTTDIPYIIKKSETLYGIARKFGVSAQQLIAANRLKNPGKIKTGATLIIPVPNEFIYTVKTDETLWRLARRYGTTVAVLKDLNSLAGDEIKVGQKLVLPVPAANIVNPQF
jgi:LysM repeat protein